MWNRFKRWLRWRSARLYVKIVREKAPVTYIARGWAIGMFCGCFLPFGLQLVVSIPLSVLTHCSKIGATLGTLITNHVTIFFIYPVQCYVGCRLIGKTMTFEQIKNALMSAMKNESLKELWRLGSDIVIGFFIGGALLAAICTPLTYYGIKKMVNQHRQRQLLKKQHQKEIANGNH